MPASRELLVEVEMEMADQHLESGHRLVHVVVRERHHRLLRGPAVFRTQVEIHRHALHGSRRRVVQREVVQLAARFPHPPRPDLVREPVRLVPDFAVRLPHADRESDVSLSLR